MSILPLPDDRRQKFTPQFSAIPHAEMNLAEVCSAEISMPYISEDDYLILATNGSYANLSICYYSKVLWDNAVTTTPTYTLYMWIEDLVLVGSSPSTLVTVVPQMEHEVVGPVSAIMSTAVKITKTVGKFVPMLTTYTKPLSWIFSGIGTIASHFGWSKPNDGTWKIMGSSFARGVNTCMDVGQATQAGYFANNEVAVLPGMAGNNVDEMSLCYLTCKPGCLAVIELTTTDSPGSVKYICPIAIENLWFQGSTKVAARPGRNTIKPFIPTPLFAASMIFRYWRGDLIFRFKFSRTKFHGGRILIGYMPIPDLEPTRLPEDGRFDFLSTIVDLRTTSEVDFVVPYTNQYPYSITERFENQQLMSNGSIFMRIIDPIFAPAGVPNVVPVVIEVFGDCNFELAAPRGSNYGVSDLPTVEPQSEHESTCIGETINSIKQLAMRPSWYNTPNGTTYGSTRNWQLHGLLTLVDGTSFTNDTTQIGMFGQWYAFWRGSVIFRSMPKDFTEYTKIVVRNGSTVNAALSFEHNIVNTVQIPYYSSQNRTRTTVAESSSVIGGHDNLPTFTVVTHADTARCESFAAADDFQLAGFIGVGTMAYVNHTMPHIFEAPPAQLRASALPTLSVGPSFESHLDTNGSLQDIVRQRMGRPSTPIGRFPVQQLNPAV